ncbi:MAG: hypothetical protein ABW167_16865 [Baekduia sp.]
MATQSASERRRVYRSTSSSLAYAGGGLALGAVMTMFGFLAWGDAGAEVICGLAIVFSAWVATRWSRCGVFVEDGGVRVLNPMSSVRLKWAEITSFQLVSYGSCVVHRAHGQPVRIFGIQQTAWDARKGKKDTDEAKMIAELNALLEAHRVGRD